MIDFKSIPICIVTPYVGVWIETQVTQLTTQLLTVTPYVGVWIETHISLYRLIGVWSHPMWVCGLKLFP